MANKSGNNVREFLRREEELETLRANVAETKKMATFAEFDVKSTKKFAGARAMRNEKLAAEEMALLDTETRTRRRARLREFYQQQEQMQSKELESMGLSFARERL